MSLRTVALATVQTWAAVTVLIELPAEGIHRWALTLPAAIIAALDAWRELRASAETKSGRNVSADYAKEDIEMRRASGCFPFPPLEDSRKP